MKQPVRRRVTGKRAATVRAPANLKEQWARLHATDAEPFPDEQRVTRLARSHPRFAVTVQQCGGAARVAEGAQQAWSEFHAGRFLRAVTLGSRFGAIGASAANKAAAVHSLYPGRSTANVLKVLEQATHRGEAAVESLPDYANAHFNLALVMGRYSQRISILAALAEGLASRVREHLERALALEPRHAEAHLALGLYHSEIIGKLGSLAARLTYNASADAALEHFRRAIKLAPESPIALMEYARGLLLLDARAHLDQARTLYAQAAGCVAVDAMEALDIERAKRGIGTD